MPPKGKDKKLSKKAQERKDKADAEAAKKKAIQGDDGGVNYVHPVLAQAVITGHLASRPDSRDLKVDQFAVTTFGKELVLFLIIAWKHFLSVF